jgi:RHS repeat-associated protein
MTILLCGFESKFAESGKTSLEERIIVNYRRTLVLVLATLALMISSLLPRVEAQTMPGNSAFTLLSQGPPTIGLTSSAGGGIDMINLSNLSINLSVPINSLGAYGPKATSSLVMNSGFSLVYDWTAINQMVRYSQPAPFHVQMPGTYMYYWGDLNGAGGCNQWAGIEALGVISPDGGYHPTPVITVDGCNTVSYSGTGPDGWSIELTQYASSGQTYSSFNPSGIQSELNIPAYYGRSNGYSIQSYDLHRNTTTSTTMIPSRAGNANQTLQDALQNQALSVTTEEISNTANYQWQPTTITYPGPIATLTPTYTLSWSGETANGNANCQAASGIPPLYQQGGWPFLNSITLPDNSSYSFVYEYYWGSTTMYTGRIQSVTLPTGANITYRYSGGTNGNGVWCSDGSTATMTKQTPDGTWTFAHTAMTGVNNLATTTVTAPSGDYAIYTMVTYKPQNPVLSILPPDPVTYQVYPVEQINCAAGVTVTACNNGTFLSKRVICYNGNTSSCTNPSSAPSLPITERDIYSYVPGVKAGPSLVVVLADQYSRTTDLKSYDFGGVRGATGWDTDVATTYGSWNGTSCQQFTTPFILVDRVCSKTLTVAGGTTPASNTYYTYNLATGDLLTEQDTIGGNLVTVDTNTYDGFGRVLTSAGPNGELTTNSYTSCGNTTLTSTAVMTNSVGGALSTQYTNYNCAGERATAVVDPNGNTSYVNYGSDPFWRPISTIDSAQNTTNYTYTPASGSTPAQTDVQTTIVAGSSSAETLTQFDSMGRPHLSQLRQGPGSTVYTITETDYDSNGRPSRTTLPYADPPGTINATIDGTTTTYDGLNRPLTVKAPAYSKSVAGSIVTYAYNENDVEATLSPAPSGENKKSRQIETNGLGRVTSVCEVTSMTGSKSCGQAHSATGFETTYTYYPGGKLQRLTQYANGGSGTTQQMRSFTYDNQNTGRPLTVTSPESGTYITTYDSDSYCGTFTGFPVAASDNLGTPFCFSYDLADRQLSVSARQLINGSYAVWSKNYVYDAQTTKNVTCPLANQAGHLGEAYTSYSYNNTTVTRTDEVYCYDNDERATDIYSLIPGSRPSYDHTAESFYVNDVPNTLTLPGQPTITYSLDSMGHLYSASDGTNTLLTSATYFLDGTPGVVTFGNGDTSTYTEYSNGVPNAATHTIGTSNNNKIVHTSTWNPNGSLAKLVTADSFNSNNSQTCTFSYDDLSRISTDNCGSNWNQSYSYDPFGNVTSAGSSPWPPGTAGTGYNLANNQYSSSIFTYDADGRLTYDTFDTLGWDKFGNLSSQSGVNFGYDALDRTYSGGASTQYYLYAPDGALAAITDSSGNVQTMFVALPASRAVYVGGALAYFNHYDWQGSSRVASTLSRGLYSDTSYDAFGISYWSSGTPNNQYAGLTSDVSSGTELVSRSRRYHPTQGRWTSPDSVIPDLYNPQTFNAYHYAMNRPTSITDSGGQDDDGGGGCPFCMPFFDDGSEGGGFSSVLFQPWSVPGDAFNADVYSSASGDLTGTWGLLSQDQFGGLSYTPWGRIDDPVMPILDYPGDPTTNGGGGLQFSASNYIPYVSGSGVNGFGNWVRDNLALLARPCAPGIACGVALPVGPIGGASEVEGAAEMGGALKPGSFSIRDWSGYPEGVPQPEGPFRILEGQEYNTARNAANSANQALRQSNPANYAGQQIHEIQPVKFGGSPTDLSNKMAIQPSLHYQVTSWWNNVMRSVSGPR